MPITVVCLVVLVVGVFMAGAAWGMRSARMDYEPIIKRLLTMLEKAFSPQEHP